MTVSLPYEPGRAAFASLARTADDLAALADGRIEELPPRYAEVRARRRSRTSSARSSRTPPPARRRSTARSASSRAPGARGTLELVARRDPRRCSAPARRRRRSRVVCPVARALARAARDGVRRRSAIPYAIEGRVRLGADAVRPGAARAAPLRVARRRPPRPVRVPALAVLGPRRARTSTSSRGGCAGAAVTDAERVEEETLKLRGPAAAAARRAPRRGATPLDGRRASSRASMLRAAYGLERAAGRRGRAARPARLRRRHARSLDELEGWRELGGELAARERRRRARAARRSRLGAARRARPRRRARPAARAHPPLRGRLRARARGGSLPRRAHGSPFLDDDARRELDGAPRARLDAARPGRARPLPLLHRLHAADAAALPRPRGGDRRRRARASRARSGTRSRALFDADDVARWTTRRPLSALTWPLDDGADRARAAARARRARRRRRGRGATRSRARTAGSAGSTARSRAFSRPTRLTHPRVLDELAARGDASASPSSSASPTARRSGSSSALIDPRTIDAEVDARLRGSVAHQALYKFFYGPAEASSAPTASSRSGSTTRSSSCASASTRRSRRRPARARPTCERRELEQSLLARPRAASSATRRESRARRSCRAGSRSSFGSERSAPELQRGLDSATASRCRGKIDRIDLDPFSARGIVQDYKSGKRAHSAAQIERELRLQIPLYMLVLRDLVGIEPLGGLYRALAGERERARAAARRAREDDAARLRAARLPRRGRVLGAGRARAGARARRSSSGSARATSRHDPQGRRRARRGATSGRCAG